MLENAGADVNALRLKRCPDKLVNAIEARSRIARKLPLWFKYPELLYPSMLSVQQCSSQATAQYKAYLLKKCFCSGCVLRGADLTGGMGVDSLFLSSLCGSFLYVERNAELYESVRENFKVLVPVVGNEAFQSERNMCHEQHQTRPAVKNIALQSECIVSSDCSQLVFAPETSSSNASHSRSIILCNCEIGPDNLDDILGNGHFDFIFIDPARRSASDSSKKLVALSEYSPDILTMKNKLLDKSSYLLVKVSPMADISQLLRELPETMQIHVVSVENDCKELLLLLKGHNSYSRTSASNLSDVNDSISVENTGKVEVFALNIPTNKCASGSLEVLQKVDYSNITFNFILGQERTCISSADERNLLSGEYRFLFEPGKSILKCGAASLQASQYGLLQLSPSSNLFVSGPTDSRTEGPETMADLCEGMNHRCKKDEYQGRVYRILEVIPFSKRTLKEVCIRYPNAGVTARNFPMNTSALVAALKTKESASEHLFFTTLYNGSKAIIAAEKLV